MNHLWIGALVLAGACNQKPPPDKLVIVVPFIDDLDPQLRSCQSPGDELPPGAPPVFINEAFAGEVGDERVDWIEIHNASDAVVQLDGWSIEDYVTADQPKDIPGRFVFPEGTSICAGGFLVVRREDGCEAATTRFDFGLGDTDTLALFDAGGMEVDRAEWTALPPGQSIGRPDDQPGPLQLLATITPGAFNSSTCECCGACLSGRCHLRDGVCVAESEEDCLMSEACLELGWCGLQDGQCVARSTEHCQQSVLCNNLGMCDARNGVCAVATDDSCRGSKLCFNEGRCFADVLGETCIAKLESDCLASEDCEHVRMDGTLSRKNRCTLDGDRCVATSCDDSTVCAERMCCTLIDGKCIGS